MDAEMWELLAVVLAPAWLLLIALIPCCIWSWWIRRK